MNNERFDKIAFEREREVISRYIRLLHYKIGKYEGKACKGCKNYLYTLTNNPARRTSIDDPELVMGWVCVVRKSPHYNDICRRRSLQNTLDRYEESGKS
jgi:hypothetical protein